MGEEIFEKEENQLDKIDKTVDKTIKDMGTIWKTCCDKLEQDNVCFICKKKLEENEKFDIVKVPDHKIDKGLVGFVSICKKCNSGEKNE